jgi:hypothetical protein
MLLRISFITFPFPFARVSIMDPDSLSTDPELHPGPVPESSFNTEKTIEKLLYEYSTIVFDTKALFLSWVSRKDF